MVGVAKRGLFYGQLHVFTPSCYRITFPIAHGLRLKPYHLREPVFVGGSRTVVMLAVAGLVLNGVRKVQKMSAPV